MGKKHHFHKADNIQVTFEYLNEREQGLKKAGYPKPKWILFCEVMLQNGLELKLYEARQTVSKYITVIKDDKEFLVRFSNHAPGYVRERNGDCDFFVGRNHNSTTTTGQAILATKGFFGLW